MDDIDADMIRLLQQFMGTKKPFHGFSEPVWRPPTDVYETADALLVTVEIAGVEKDSFHLEFIRNALIVRGSRTHNLGAVQASYHRMEIKYGAFEVEFHLPLGLDCDRTTARYSEGFLTITIPKETAETPKIININIEG
jgi:HSP20 family protein